MKVAIQTTKEDYIKFIKKYCFKKDLRKRLILLIIISLTIGISKGDGQSFVFAIFFLKASASAILLFIFFSLIPYIILLNSIKKSFKTNLLLRSKTIILNDEGINIISENEDIYWKWETLKNADIIDEYLFYSLFTNKLYLIPLRFFSSNNEAVNFLGFIKNGIQKVRGENKYRKIRNLYYWGLVGFVPNFGVIAGIVLIIKGFQYNKINLMLVGVADILLTVLFWIVVSLF